MMNEISIKFPVSQSSEIHVGAAGGVRVNLKASQEESFVLPCGRNIPVLCVGLNGGWDVWFVGNNPDEVSLSYDGRECFVTFSAEHGDVLYFDQIHLDGWENVVAWLRARLNLGEKIRKAPRFDRAFIFDIHDAGGKLIQNFDQVRHGIDEMANAGWLDRSIVYLPGWDGAYDGTYPDYHASTAAGGWDALESLGSEVAAAGGQLLLHLNYWGIAEGRLKAYPSLAAELLKNADGSLMKWPGATWCGATNPLYYARPDSEPWLKIMKHNVDAIVGHGINGIFLDQFGAPMRPFGSKRIAMATTYAKVVCANRPGVILGCELPMPETVDEFHLAQMWGAPWSGMPENRSLEISSLSSDVYNGYVQMFGHLGTPAPYPMRYSWTNYVFLAEHGSSNAFKMAWDAHRKANVLPTLRLDSQRSADNLRIAGGLFPT